MIFPTAEHYLFINGIFDDSIWKAHVHLGSSSVSVTSFGDIVAFDLLVD